MSRARRATSSPRPVSLIWRGPKSAPRGAAEPDAAAPGYRTRAANDDIIEGEFRRED
jgi:hypothetical protein